MSRAEEVEDDERQRQRKLEEALEIKSLRRIISAYINYPEAAEEDVRRYERSFRKLSPAHKALLSHYPLKFERLRRCISVNSYFIFNMLQAFEPPLDMSEDIDICEDSHHKDGPNNQSVSGGQDGCCQSTTTSRVTCCPKSDQDYNMEGSNMTCKSLEGATSNKELDSDGCCGSHDESHPQGFPYTKEMDKSGGNTANDCNGNVSSSPHGWFDLPFQLNVPLVDVDKVRCIVRNIVRDWAAEGKKERDQCYKPILEELDSLFPNRSKERTPACLVPGAGLGRLALEISCLGFMSQGNEFSYYMMICSSFILNNTQIAGEWTIYPWIHSNCNSLSDSDQLRPISIPDIHPASAGITEGFSMCGGDFVEVYSDPSQVGVWDAVVTCFFIDTAHNIVEYIEIISKVLKDGGVWINLGPLLYHFADIYGQEDDMSIELSLEDVKKVALHYGFQFEKERTIETTYTTNPRSMMQNRYFAAFWTMRKNSSAAEKHIAQ
ncbi:S-adenosyl-L-methionine-dependent methyltransferases superfamily protein [Quillaja saponaria]|uniref:carnosine N-methyltransferase n=1 Tax=Quillaja saponaria TaxID=32244 RepID=A0AAD7PQM8_QUISA|nr:S-adenosyl-L-methionine-dependent methyltransferases superfamily protein [Quillaja saponaria]